MRDALLQYFGPQEERLKILDEEIIVRTLPDSTPAEMFAGEDVFWKMVTRCAFYPDGNPAFTDEDIPALKKAPRMRVFPLVQAVQRVNAMDLEAEVKNSGAGPSSG